MRRGDRDKEQLWEKVRKTVKPLRSTPQPVTFEQMMDETSAPTPARRPDLPRIVRPHLPDEPLVTINRSAKLPVLDEPTAKKIAKGKLSIEGRIDLHGMTQEEAHSRLFRFVEGAHLAGKRTVLVITGKGVRGEGVLKQAVPRWLAEPVFRKRVIGFREAHVSHGGSGALYLRIRKPEHGT